MSSDFPMGHGLYFFLTRAILCLAFFLAKRYKFRIREVEINIYQIAEDHITHNIEQEEAYNEGKRGMNHVKL